MNGTGLNGPKRRLNATCCVGREILTAEEHDLVVEHRAADLGDHLVVEIVREIDAADDRTARAGHRLDGDAPVRVPVGCRGNGDEPRRRGLAAGTREASRRRER